jgi:enterochelin esterase-like enzyme
MKILSVSFIFVLFIFGCDDDSANNTQSCGANEHLEDMACVCNDGYHFENNECISESNNCTEPCGDNEHCEDGACVCDDGYHRDGDNCVLDNTNPCANVDCGEQGSCVNIEGAAACECDYGYVSSDQFCIHLRDAFDQAVANQDSDLVWLLWSKYDHPVRLNGEILFITRAQPDEDIRLIGDFNAWDENAQPMSTLFLDEFRYQIVQVSHNDPVFYKYKSNEWYPDPDNQYFIFNPDNNSVVFGEGKGRITARTVPSVDLNNNERQIYIYLPGAYFQSSSKFPAIYMQDGDNLFAGNPLAIFGTWNIRTNLDQAIEDGLLEPVAVVGITTVNREEEYLHVDGLLDTEQVGKLDLYTNYLINTVIPEMETSFRFESAKESRAVSGSSLGGISSFIIAWGNPDSVGEVASCSPSSWIGEEPESDHLVSMLDIVNSATSLPTLKIYLDSGDTNQDGTSTYASDARVYTEYLRNQLISKGWSGRSEWLESGETAPINYSVDTPQEQIPTLWWSADTPQDYSDYFDYLKPQNNLLHLVGQQHKHNEPAWSQRVNAAFIYLFPTQSGS